MYANTMYIFDDDIVIMGGVNIEDKEKLIIPRGKYITINFDDDYKDIFSRTFDNSIGSVCKMERSLVHIEMETK